MSGFVQLARSTQNGWENPLLVRKSGQIISATGALEHEKSYASATVAQGEARIGFIPSDELRGFIDMYPVFGLNLVRQQEELIRSLSYLWVNAE